MSLHSARGKRTVVKQKPLSVPDRRARTTGPRSGGSPKAGLEKIGAVVAWGVTTPRKLGSDMREEFNAGYAWGRYKEADQRIVRSRSPQDQACGRRLFQAVPITKAGVKETGRRGPAAPTGVQERHAGLSGTTDLDASARRMRGPWAGFQKTDRRTGDAHAPYRHPVSKTSMARLM